MAGDAAQRDGAADALDIGLHHIHADAAAADRGDRGRRREAGAQDEALDLHVVHDIELGLAGEPLVEDAGADLVDRQAAAVIGDLDHDMAAFMEGVQRDAAALGLSRGEAVGGGLEPVIGRVAHHMGERGP